MSAHDPSSGDEEPPSIGIDRYRELLREFDAAVCEAIAVGQASANRLEAPYVGYTTIVFVRLCSYAQSLIRAVPRSRWTSSDADHWEFGAIAGHARAIMEGFLLLKYVTKEPETPDEWSTRLLVMHLNDCTRRVRLFQTLDNTGQVDGLTAQAEDLRARLKINPWFLKLTPSRQKELLSGQPLTVTSRDQQIDAAGLSRARFDMLWLLFSQYAHVLPISFYRMEPNGRGTGVMNDADMGYMAIALEICAEIMTASTDRMVELFPDTAWARQGIESKFAPGPRSNLPKHMKRRSKR